MRFNAAKCHGPVTLNFSTTHAKYFGVTFSNDLEWSKHIATKTNKANSKLSFLRRNLKGCPEKLKQTAYFSLIRSSMEYGATVLDPYPLSQRRQEARLILFYKMINGLARVPFEGVLVEAYKGTRRKHICT